MIAEADPAKEEESENTKFDKKPVSEFSHVNETTTKKLEKAIQNRVDTISDSIFEELRERFLSCRLFDRSNVYLAF